MSELGNCDVEEHLMWEEFCAKCTQCEPNSVQHHVQLFKDVFEALVKNEIHLFNKLCLLINYLANQLTSRETLRTHYNHVDNPLKGSNIIIIACRENKSDILEHIFQNETIFENFASISGKNILSSDEDREHHTAFYYAIRSGNVILAETLVNKWPGGFLNHQLDVLLSTAYDELKLKNVQISEQMMNYIENKLLNIRFWADDKSTSHFNKKDAIKRIKFLCENIRFLLIKYCEKDIDEAFLLTLRYIAQNVHILKGLLKITYDSLPWEEIEFCLISFINSTRQCDDEQFINCIILNKKKLLLHLEIFAKCLHREINRIQISSTGKLQEMPQVKRDKIVIVILKKSPEFKNLYSDYEKIRDHNSLKIMNQYLELAMSADCTTPIGQLVIIRTLQILGENLKNTLQSPRLSPATSELLLCSLTRNTRKILIQLRDNLSHAHSLLRRVNIERNESDFFNHTQNDIKSLYPLINDILFRNKISIIRMLLERISNSNSSEELKNIIEPFSNFDIKNIVHIFTSKAESGDLYKMKELISELNIIVKDKTPFETELMNNFNQIIKKERSFSKNQSKDYFQGFCFLKNWNEMLKYSVFDQNWMRVMKYSAKQTLEFLKSEINPDISFQLNELLKTFATSVFQRLDKEVSCDVKRIFYKVIMLLGSKCDVQCLEDVHYNITRSKFSPAITENNFEESEFDVQLSLKISTLKELLPVSFSQNKAIYENLPKGNDKNLMAAVEMLLLEILAILEEKKKCLTNNQLFLDEHCPTLVGKNLRNHLAHGNSIINILNSDYLCTLLFNANILCNEEIIKNERRIGKIVCSTIAKLQSKYNHDMKIINCQEEMIHALEEGNLNIVKSLIENGADIKARSLNMSTALHHAAKGCSIDCVKFVIDQGIITDLKNINGENALHTAVKHGQKNVINFLIRESNMNINDPDNSGKTCLHFASQNGFKDIVLLLLKYGAKLDCRVTYVLSPIHFAVLNNRVNIVEVLLEKINVNHETLGGYSLLHIASENGFLDIVKLLIRKKANVNARNDNFDLPIHTTAFNGHLEVVKTLISEGSNVSDQNIHGCTPLHYAVENGHKHIVEILLDHSLEINLTENSFNRTPLSYAAESGCTEIVELLLQHGAHVDIASVEGNTALHFAAFKGRMEIVVLLIRHGACINISDKRGLTALHLSSLSGHSNVVEYLMEKGGNVNALTLMNETPLHFAVKNADVIEVLLQKGADKNVQNCMGDTALHSCCIEGCTNNIKLLIKEGADLFIRNDCGMTPLHLAVVSGVWEAVEILIAAGADKFFSDFKGLTTLHLAALHGHENVVKGLIKIYNNFNVDENGLTPLHLAVMGNHAEVVKVLIENGSEVNAVADSWDSTQFSSMPNFKEIFMKLIDENSVNSAYGSLPIPAFLDNSLVNHISSSNRYCKLTPLHLAVHNNNIDIVSFLLSRGADVNAQQSDSIALAIIVGFKDVAEMLIKNKNFKTNESYSNDFSLLHVAAWKGQNTVAETLLIKGANVNSQSFFNSRMTPLHLASENGFSQTVKILIKYGASVNKQAVDGTTPLHRAAVAGHEKIVHILLVNKAGRNIKDLKFRTPLVQAVAHGHQKIVEKLLDTNEINMNHSGQHDFTLLHIAAQEGNLELTKYLTDKGANIHCMNNVGSKPIHIAARDGHKHIVEYFLNKNMSIDVTGIGGASLLHYAAHGRQVEVTQFLLEKKANPNRPNMLGSTPMHIASKCSAKEVVQMLLDNGAFYNTLDLQHLNPCECASSGEIKDLLKTCDELFHAVKKNNPSVVESCLKKHVVVNIKNKSDETPLLYAAWKGYDQVIDILLKYKANPNITGKAGSSPLHYASKFSHVNIVKTLLSNGAIYNLKNESQKTPLDFAEKEEIINLLKFVDETFRNVQNGNVKVIYDLEKVIGPIVNEILLNVCNIRNQTLLVCAVHNDFPKMKKLKEVLDGDMSTKTSFAEALCFAEHYEVAQNILEREVDKKKEIYGSDNPSTFDAQLLIAKTYYKQQHYEKALNMFQDLYEKQIKLFGVKNADVQRTRCGIGLVLHRQKKNQEALAIFREVLQVQNELLGPSDTDILDTLIGMALVLVDLGENNEALSINRDILKKMKSSFGSNDPRTLCVENNIAMILNNLGKWEESLKMYKLVFEKRKSVLGHGHSDTLRTMFNTSSVLLSQNQDQEALDILRQVLAIQRQELKPHHPDTINTQFVIGSIFFKQGKFLLALNILKYSHKMKLNMLGPAHPQVMQIAEMINFIHKKFSRQGITNSMILQQAGNQLQVAASSGDKSIVEICIDCGSDINFRDCSGRTALHCAAANGHKETVITLVGKGADCLLASSGKGNTALHLAAAKGYKDITEVLLMHVKKIKRAKLKHFVNAGTSVLGNTALHIASNIATVKTLLKYGAIYDIKNKKGETPLDVAKSHDIAEFLHFIHELFVDAKVGKLELICNVRTMTHHELIVLANTQNKDGMTVLQVAKSNKNERLANDLVTILQERKCFELT